MLSSISNLESNKLDAIQQLENELGKSLVAISCHKIGMADLNKNELSKIQDLEKTFSISLVAVEA